jgi:PPOX class probable F420-dependent enzyme
MRMTKLSQFADLVSGDHGLAVVAVSRPDGTVACSVVNAGVLSHPVTGAQVVGLVARGDARKLRYLRARPRATAVLRAGWQWAAAEGPVELAGPDDGLDGVDAERLRVLLREIFTAAGGTHEDWDTYDRAMAAERRTAVLISPERVYSNV